MRKQNLIKRLLFTSAIILATATLFSACKKKEPQYVPAAHLMAFNLIPDVAGVGVGVDNNSIVTTPMPYASFNGRYVPVYIGNRQLSSFNFGTGAVLASGAETFKDSAYYSLFAMGTTGNYKNIFAEDDFRNLDISSGKAAIRYVNGIIGDAQTTTTIQADGSNVFEGATAMGAVSAYKTVPAGKISVSLTNPDVGETVSRELDVTAGGLYTILLIGDPASTDENRQVEIKMALQGNLVP